MRSKERRQGSAEPKITKSQNGSDPSRGWRKIPAVKEDIGKEDMKRFIITGAPGAGKTSIIRHLELDGFGVVEEAATDLIAAAQARGVVEPRTDPRFLERIARLQTTRNPRCQFD